MKTKKQPYDKVFTFSTFKRSLKAELFHQAYDVS